MAFASKETFIRMRRSFKTIDLFAGPGGLAEGFSSVRRTDGSRVFDIALSVEKERSAFETLRLRAFVRQFDEIPVIYYDYLAGRVSKHELIDRHPDEWNAALVETAMLELGTDAAKAVLDPRLDGIRETAAGNTVLIGGPPCQAYSLVGRARNKGNKAYVPADDHRHFLYKEYIRILDRLQPVAFIMENVKGILSSKVAGESIFERVLEDLRGAGSTPDSYVLLPLVNREKVGRSGHIIRSEDYGIPQSRHRVILLGIRRDAIRSIPQAILANATLEPVAQASTVVDVLSSMPPLRSGLSKTVDDPESWRATVTKGFRHAASSCRQEGTWLAQVAKRLTAYAERVQAVVDLPPRSSRAIASVSDNRLGAWLVDPRLPVLPNHESRGHMASDLARYAFAAAFSEVFGRSPKADEFPEGLAPDHKSWKSGKFADRFRAQGWNAPSTTITSHISKDGHYFIHPDPFQCRSLTVREAARLQTFPDNYYFEGNRTQQFVQVGNAVPPFLARQIGELLARLIDC